MPNDENSGTNAGNRQLNANTGVTIGLAFAVFAATGTAIYKAGEVITDLGYLKAYVADLRSDVSEMKRIIQRIDSQQRSPPGKQSAGEGSIDTASEHAEATPILR